MAYHINQRKSLQKPGPYMAPVCLAYKLRWCSQESDFMSHKGKLKAI